MKCSISNYLSFLTSFIHLIFPPNFRKAILATPFQRTILLLYRYRVPTSSLQLFEELPYVIFLKKQMVKLSFYESLFMSFLRIHRRPPPTMRSCSGKCTDSQATG